MSKKKTPKPKFGPKTTEPLSTLRRVEDEVATDRILNTLLSINNDACEGKMKASPVTNPFFRVRSELEERKPDQDYMTAGLDELSCGSIADLLLARLKAQGYVLYFDQKVAQATMDKARARLSGMVPDL